MALFRSLILHTTQIYLRPFKSYILGLYVRYVHSLGIGLTPQKNSCKHILGSPKPLEKVPNAQGIRDAI